MPRVYVTTPPAVLPPPPLDPQAARQAAEAGVALYAACVLAATVGQLPKAQVARLLCVRRAVIDRSCAQLLRAGFPLPQGLLMRQRITPHEVERVKRLAARGLTAEAISDRTGMSLSRVRWGIAYKHLGGLARHGAGWYSQQQVRAMFGVSGKAIRTWRERGWLAASRPSADARDGRATSPSLRYAIQRPDLFAFVRERDAWPTYDPARITDDDLRQAAQLARATAGGRWVSGPELARQLHFSPLTIAWRISHRGWPGAGWHVTMWDHTYFIWMPNGAVLPSVEDVPRPAPKKGAARAS